MLLIRLLLYYKRIQLRDSQMEGMRRARYRERAQSFHAFSEDASI